MSTATTDLVTFSLLDLSWEDVLFVSVLPLLPPCDWFRLRAVNRKHFDLVNQFFVRNRRLDLSNNKKVTVGMFKICTEQAENIRYLNLAGSKWLTDELLRNVIINNPNLRYLNLSECHHCTSGILEAITLNSRCLKILILSDCHWVSKESVQFHTNEGAAKQLTEVDFTGCWELGDQILVDFLSRFPNISTLRLGNIYSLTDLTLRAVSSYCRDLQHLDIRGCWRVSDAGVRLLGEYCHGLSRLEVSDCRDVSEQSLARIRQRGVRIDRRPDPVLLRLLRIRRGQQHARLNV